MISLVDAANLRDVEGEGFAAAYRRAADDVRRVAERLAAPNVRRALPGGDGAGFEISSTLPRRLRGGGGEGQGVHPGGDAFQIVPSQRFFAEIGDLDPFLLYRGLRTVNPSPYMTYLKLGDLALVGASPEPLVRLEGRHVMIRPEPAPGDAAPRPKKTLLLAEELLADAKGASRARHARGPRMNPPGTGRRDRDGHNSRELYGGWSATLHVYTSS